MKKALKFLSVKRVLKVLGVLVLIFALLFVLNFVRLLGLVGTADEFFEAARQGDVDRAHTQLAKDLRTYTSKDDLMTYFEELRLMEVKELRWGAREVSGDLGYIVAVLTFEDGESFPLYLVIRKEEDGWKILRIEKTLPSAEAEQVDEKPVIPDDELIRLVNRSNMAFAEAVHAKSMEKFRNQISVLWQNQTDVLALDGTFWSFYALGADLRVLGDATPVFKAPAALDERGVLTVAGSYPMDVGTFNFEHSYIKEGLGWKLVGFSATIEE